MSYDKQTWTNGEVITADKMNHIEDGIANSGGGGSSNIIMRVSRTEGTKTYYDKTWQEVYDAIADGQLVLVSEDVDVPQGVMLTMIVGVGSGLDYDAYDTLETEYFADSSNSLLYKDSSEPTPES